MQRVEVVDLPIQLEPRHVHGRVVVVLDVLRATTTITAALANGASEVRVFGSLDEARAAPMQFDGARVLAGEQRCLRPEGFDLGNSPGEFTAERVGGRTIFMSTTNGTRAILAARGAVRLFAGSIVNAFATARMLSKLGGDVTLLCAGTNGQPAEEDLAGAKLILQNLDPSAHSAAEELYEILRKSQGGQNVLAAGLEADIHFASRVDVFDIAVEIRGEPPTARVMNE